MLGLSARHSSGRCPITEYPWAEAVGQATKSVGRDDNCWYCNENQENVREKTCTFLAFLVDDLLLGCARCEKQSKAEKLERT